MNRKCRAGGKRSRCENGGDAGWFKKKMPDGTRVIWRAGGEREERKAGQIAINSELEAKAGDIS